MLFDIDKLEISEQTEYSQPSPIVRRIIEDYTNLSTDESILNEGCKFLSIDVDKNRLRNLKPPCLAIIELELTAIYPSIYQNNKYTINIKCLLDYPFRPPIVIFKTPIDHINVCDGSGQVIHAFLKDEWCPLGLRPVIMEMLQLFTVERPQDLINF